MATDEDGEVVQTLDYYPYGSQRIATGSFSEQRRFIGEEYDGDTEFSYLNARYYQGPRGQFMSQDPVFLEIGSEAMDERSRRQLNALLADPQLLNAYSYAKNNPLVLVDQSGQIAVSPLIYLGLQAYSEFTLGYSAGEVLSRDVLFRGNYTTQEKVDARYMLGFNALAERARGGLNATQDAFLILAPDAITVLENSTSAAQERKRREEHRSHSRANVIITNTSSSGGSGSGSTYNYIYSKPFGGPVGNWSPQRIMGPYNFSSAQQGALHNFVSVVNAGSFDAQAFVSALQGVVSAFSVK